MVSDFPPSGNSAPQTTNRDMEWDSPFDDNRKRLPRLAHRMLGHEHEYLGETLISTLARIDHVPGITQRNRQSEAVTGKPFANYWMHS